MRNVESNSIMSLIASGNKQITQKKNGCMYSINILPYLWYSKSWAPVFFKYVEADGSLGVDITMINPGTESHLQTGNTLSK